MLDVAREILFYPGSPFVPELFKPYTGSTGTGLISSKLEDWVL